MGVQSEISKTITAGGGIGALYIGLTAATLADLLPHPMDAVYFHLQKTNRDKFVSGEITPEQYWRRNVIAYYGCDAVWWGFLLGMAVLTKGELKDKLIVVGSLIGAGAVIGVISKNIREDIQEQKSKKFDIYYGE
jgi:hypothetical protein